ncbi:MAG: DUF2461 domain-containing protein [Flavobacteriaceae bacterium TMED206]|nr:MAG: DUF2461 domain-containing protein [Flavobacteriaceae bacterium TMED206]|tara:strand:- start:1867 stop:2535 length:669 start_codon:yes stop_codon:yes gene_type:complete
MIKSEVLKFLNDLNSNNNRDWFNTNKKRYEDSLEQIKSFTTELVELMNLHDKIENYRIFRIYRDIRFSKNKTPYKNNFGISLVREKPWLRGGYYLHIKPSDSFSAVGFWQPDKNDLFRIRKEIEIDGKEFNDMISSKLIIKNWGNLVGDSLKTNPRGFSKDHEYISILRKKSFLFKKSYSNKEVISKDFLSRLNEDFLDLRSFLDYMSNILTTDLNGISILK